MATELSCRCGSMTWSLANNAPGTALTCYCKDCRRYAKGQGMSDLLDEAGGTRLFQTLPSQVTMTKGAEHLSVLQLSPKGIFRWHAGCCGTPIANTLPSPGLPFAGMVLPQDGAGLGLGQAVVHAGSALKPVKAQGGKKAIFSLMARALGARLRGDKATPFFDPSGTPAAEPSLAPKDHGIAKGD